MRGQHLVAVLEGVQSLARTRGARKDARAFAPGTATDMLPFGLCSETGKVAIPLAAIYANTRYWIGIPASATACSVSNAADQTGNCIVATDYNDQRLGCVFPKEHLLGTRQLERAALILPALSGGDTLFSPVGAPWPRRPWHTSAVRVLDGALQFRGGGTSWPREPYSARELRQISIFLPHWPARAGALWCVRVHWRCNWTAPA